MGIVHLFILQCIATTDSIYIRHRLEDSKNALDHFNDINDICDDTARYLHVTLIIILRVEKYAHVAH